MKKPKAPCMDCLDRMIGCHGICNAYKTYKQEQQEYNLSLKDPEIDQYRHAIRSKKRIYNGK